MRMAKTEAAKGRGPRTRRRVVRVRAPGRAAKEGSGPGGTGAEGS